MEAYESESDDVDESLTVPKPPERGVCARIIYAYIYIKTDTSQDDPIIEYEDEFGRIRTARRSEVPRDVLPPEPDEDEYVTMIYPV